MPRLLPGRFLCALLLVVALSGVAGAQGSPILIEFFFEPGCSECGRVRAEILPELKMRYEGFYELREYDIGIPDNYLRLAAYQERLGISGNASVSMILDSREVLNGFEAIADGLFPLIDRLSQEHLSGSGTAVLPPSPAAPDLKSRFNAFTLLGVVTAGLIDGINPCAISTLVFFMSLLATLKVSGRRLVTVGVAFCLASFLTYTGIGFGLFRALHLFSGFTSVRAVVNAVMIVMLLVFAAFSFKDAWQIPPEPLGPRRLAATARGDQAANPQDHAGWAGDAEPVRRQPADRLVGDRAGERLHRSGLHTDAGHAHQERAARGSGRTST